MPIEKELVGPADMEEEAVVEVAVEMVEVSLKSGTGGLTWERGSCCAHKEVGPCLLLPSCARGSRSEGYSWRMGGCLTPQFSWDWKE
jgi:hypothetical protein